MEEKKDFLNYFHHEIFVLSFFNFVYFKHSTVSLEIKYFFFFFFFLSFGSHFSSCHVQRQLLEEGWISQIPIRLLLISLCIAEPVRWPASSLTLYVSRTFSFRLFIKLFIRKKLKLKIKENLIKVIMKVTFEMNEIERRRKLV